jgi:hypothetical protein
MAARRCGTSLRRRRSSKMRSSSIGARRLGLRSGRLLRSSSPKPMGLREITPALIEMIPTAVTGFGVATSARGGAGNFRGEEAWRAPALDGTLAR